MPDINRALVTVHVTASSDGSIDMTRCLHGEDHSRAPDAIDITFAEYAAFEAFSVHAQFWRERMAELPDAIYERDRGRS